MSLSRRARGPRALMAVLALGAAASAELAPAASLLVTSTLDAGDVAPCDGACDDGSGDCTLRAAIDESNCNPFHDTIRFALPGVGVHNIAIGSSLPVVFDHAGLTIDCTTQPGWSGTPVIVIDAALVTAGYALQTSAGHMMVKGCAFVGAGTYGIVLSGGHLSYIFGNWFGIDPATGGPRGNGLAGMLVIDSNQNQIGGTRPGDPNVFSGNGVSGLDLSGVGALTNVVQGNFLGTDATGLIALPNALYGIRIDGGTSNIIGGSARGARNVISGNGFAGIFISGATSTGNEILGNRIGTDVSGKVALPNYHGILTDGASDTRIGGPDADEGNQIAGNLDAGIAIEDGSARVSVLGNLIGLASDASTPLANGGDGIRISGNSSASTIGGGSPGAGNVIAGNEGCGILVVDGSGHRISGNSIRDNARLGIDLGNDAAPTANDAGDPDSGANGLQNFPEVVTVTVDCSTTTVAGTLASRASETYTIEAFASSDCDPSGFGEGAVYLGATSVTSDASGAATFQLTSPTRLLASQRVTATATDVAGSTSEFSPCQSTVQTCPGCGNGLPDPGEQCDSSGIDTAACDSDCTFPVCGDGHVNRPAGETCDDSNTSNGDGCSATCQIETCLVASLGRIAGLQCAKASSDPYCSWTADPAAASYHLNSVTQKADLADPRRAPGNGVAECDVAAPVVSCVDTGGLGGSEPLRFYQALSACGPGGADEGPF